MCLRRWFKVFGIILASFNNARCTNKQDYMEKEQEGLVMRVRNLINKQPHKLHVTRQKIMNALFLQLQQDLSLCMLQICEDFMSTRNKLGLFQ